MERLIRLAVFIVFTASVPFTIGYLASQNAKVKTGIVKLLK